MQLCARNQQTYSQMEGSDSIKHANEYKILEQRCASDLEKLRLCFQHGAKPPLFHYERRQMNIVQVNHDLGENDLEVKKKSGQMPLFEIFERWIFIASAMGLIEKCCFRSPFCEVSICPSLLVIRQRRWRPMSLLSFHIPLTHLKLLEHGTSLVPTMPSIPRHNTNSTSNGRMRNFDGWWVGKSWN